MKCQAFVGYVDGFTLTCELVPGHLGDHHDPDRVLQWDIGRVALDMPDGITMDNVE
jgi:hypothetical protein